MKDVKDLTKEDRLEVYRKAREIYKQEIANGELPGMCWHIWTASQILWINIYMGPINSVYNSHLQKQYWPEFAALKPKNSDSFWWPRQDTESRLKAFDKLCKE
jgi:hypothetical protein